MTFKSSASNPRGTLFACAALLTFCAAFGGAQPASAQSSVVLAAAGQLAGNAVVAAPVERSAHAAPRTSRAPFAPLDADGRARYTIVLADAPLASYRGENAAFAPIPAVATGVNRGRPDVDSPQAAAYAAHLAQAQDRFLDQAAQALGRAPVAEQRFQHALNAVVLRLTPAEAALIGQRDDVRLVSRERIHPLATYATPTFIGANTIWNGSNVPGGIGSKGEGVVVGVLDTGINWQSNSFKATGDDGYVTINPLGSGVFKGTCNSSGDTGHCNNKLIGMYNFISALAGRSGADTDGHGSHTASTAAGGVVNNASFAGGTFALSGVAPHANIIAYLVCDANGCGDVAIQGAINQAVADTIVNVINYSIGGPSPSPWDDASALAFLGAQNAGIFVSASAGNSGPGASTTDNEEPWVATVAATTPGSIPSFDFDLTGPGSPPANTINLAVIPGSAPLPAQAYTNLPLIQSPTFSDGSDDGCDAFAANYFKRPQTAGGTGGIAVIRLDQNDSNCASGVRRTNCLLYTSDAADE